MRKVTARTRHQEYFIDLIADTTDWQLIDKIYPQLQHSFQCSPDDEMLLQYFWALQTYQDRRGLGREQLVWAQLTEL